jgi:hypothetical protein
MINHTTKFGQKKPDRKLCPAGLYDGNSFHLRLRPRDQATYPSIEHAASCQIDDLVLEAHPENISHFIARLRHHLRYSPRAPTARFQQDHLSYN